MGRYDKNYENVKDLKEDSWNYTQREKMSGYLEQQEKEYWDRAYKEKRENKYKLPTYQEFIAQDPTFI